MEVVSNKRSRPRRTETFDVAWQGQPAPHQYASVSSITSFSHTHTHTHTKYAHTCSHCHVIRTCERSRTCAPTHLVRVAGFATGLAASGCAPSPPRHPWWTLCPAWSSPETRHRVVVEHTCVCCKRRRGHSTRALANQRFQTTDLEHKRNTSQVSQRTNQPLSRISTPTSEPPWHAPLQVAAVGRVQHVRQRNTTRKSRGALQHSHT